MGVLVRNFTLFPKLCEIRKIHPIFGFVLEKVIFTLSQMQNKRVFDKPGEFFLEVLSRNKREAFLHIVCKGNGFHLCCLLSFTISYKTEGIWSTLPVGKF